MTEPDSGSEIAPDDQQKLDQHYPAVDAPSPTVPSWLRNSLVTIVTVLWSASLIADLVISTYDPPATLNLIMMAVVSAVLGSGVVQALPKRRGK